MEVERERADDRRTDHEHDRARRLELDDLALLIARMHREVDQSAELMAQLADADVIDRRGRAGDRGTSDQHDQTTATPCGRSAAHDVGWRLSASSACCRSVTTPPVGRLRDTPRLRRRDHDATRTFERRVRFVAGRREVAVLDDIGARRASARRARSRSRPPCRRAPSGARRSSSRSSARCSARRGSRGSRRSFRRSRAGAGRRVAS